jgi:cytoskeletal protein CcmA (bactofilin family)
MVSWIGKSVVFKGDLESAEDMTIDGRVEGTVQLREHALTIGLNADVRADVTARTVNILGAFAGTITATGKVIIVETGSVDGNVIAPRIAVAEGAVVRGKIDSSASRPEAGQKPRLVAV